MGIECAGQSTATVKGNATQKQDDAQRAKLGLPSATPNSTALSYTTHAGKVDPNNPLGFSVAPPPAAPRLDSPEMQMRRASQKLFALSGRGRRSAFLGGYGPGALTPAE